MLVSSVGVDSEGSVVGVDSGKRKPLVLIAGGGIGGLVAAIGLLKAGYDVKVFERDATAIRGEGAYRGPIQVSICVCDVMCVYRNVQMGWIQD